MSSGVVYVYCVLIINPDTSNILLLTDEPKN